MLRFTIDLYTHGFSVRVAFSGDKTIMALFRSTLAVYETKFDFKIRRNVSMLKMTYSTYIPKTAAYGFPIEVYEDFLNHLNGHGISPGETSITIHEVTQGKKATIGISDAVELYDYQPPIVDFECNPVHTCVLHLQTGKGKTLCTLVAIARMGVRAVGIMASTYVPAWIKDSAWVYTNPECLLVVNGNKALRQLIRDGKRNKIKHHVIIITLATLRNYFTEYEETGKSTYGCIPSELFKVLGAGVRFTDEAHKDLHFQFRVNCLTNVAKAIYLTATINSKDPFKNKMYKLIFPLRYRYNGLAWDKYIDVVAISYTLENPAMAKYMGSMGYSHVIYEEYLLTHPVLLQNYLKMVASIVVNTYVAKYQLGMKILIYAAKTDMCDAICAYLKQHEICGDYTSTSFNGSSLEEILHTHDIVVTTPQKSGTGKDVAKLAYVLCTMALDTYEGNTQMLGRLRKIEKHYPGISPIFIYIVCTDIGKHIDYHHTKVKLFTPLTKSIVCYRSHYVV